MTTYIIKMAGAGTVISEKVDADSFLIQDGLIAFRQTGVPAPVFMVGVSRLISVKPEGS